jgi:hypothetical protein
VELADGTLAVAWTPDRCTPGPRPKSVRVAYARGGREYRDTVDLGPAWKWVDSFRAASVDTLTPDYGRFHFIWDWPKGYSAVPERDWIEMGLVGTFSGEYSDSRPDVFQRGVTHGIEGGSFRYDGFDPASGAWALKGSLRRAIRFAADFTLARREDHDLRLYLDNLEKGEIPIRFDFVNSWPADGRIDAGQALRVQAKSEPADVFTDPWSGYGPVALELIPEGAEEGPFLKYPWDGSVLPLSFPGRDTLAFRLKAWVTDQLRTIKTCQIPALSPVLRAAPSATDTASAP